MFPRETTPPFGDFEDMDSEEEPKDTMICHYHGTCRHTTDNCTALKALVKQAKQKKGKYFKKRKRHIKYEVNMMVLKQVKKAIKKEEKETY